MKRAVNDIFRLLGWCIGYAVFMPMAAKEFGWSIVMMITFGFLIIIELIKQWSDMWLNKNS